jgi:hypothetical protein
MNAIGMWRVATGTVAAAISANIDNVFTSDYTNYRVYLYNIDGNGAETALLLRLRASGTTATGTDYNYQILRLYSTGTGSNGGANSTSDGVQILTVSTTGDTQHGSTVFDISQPQLAKPTSVTGIGHMYNNAVSAGMLNVFGGFHAVQTAYDGLEIRSANGSTTIAYNYEIYGYRKG